MFSAKRRPQITLSDTACCLPHNLRDNLGEMGGSSNLSSVVRNICAKHLLQMFGLKEASIKLQDSAVFSHYSRSALHTSEPTEFQRIDCFEAQPNWPRNSYNDSIVFDFSDVIFPTSTFVRSQFNMWENETATTTIVPSLNTRMFSKPLDRFFRCVSSNPKLIVQEKFFNRNFFETVYESDLNESADINWVLDIYRLFFEHYFITDNVFPSETENIRADVALVELYTKLYSTFASTNVYASNLSKFFTKVVENVDFSSAQLLLFLGGTCIPYSDNNGITKTYASENKPNVRYDSDKGIVASRDIILGDELVLETDGYQTVENFFDFKCVATSLTICKNQKTRKAINEISESAENFEFF